MPGSAFRIGEAARRAGVSPDTLRYYERVGALPKAARTAAGYRVYSDASVVRIRFVRNAVRFGFSLKQIADFLRARESGHPPCRQVRAAAGRLLDEMDRQIASMTDARAAIRATLEQWDERLAATRPGAAARLLDTPAPRPAAIAALSRSRLARR